MMEADIEKYLLFILQQTQSHFKVVDCAADI